jgi:hypothetical protein
MPSLSRENRKLLENKVVAAPQSAVAGARKALIALRVGDKESPADPDQKALRNQLRAHGRQLGDARQSDGTQETRRLEQACAYEHWHRMLFARFLAENDLLVNPDYGVPMSLAEIQETSREKGQDWISLASDYAQRMLLEVFRPDDPALRVVVPPETRQELEELLRELPVEIFTADDSLGWVYQFWQRDEKERVNKSEVKIGADELSPVTQLFTEDYMVLFLLHNTLGAWWAAKRRAEGKTPDLPDYEWTYLRLNDDGSPAVGSFDGWPKTAREIRVLDPCMGSGHFLTFTLPMLARMRQEEDGLSVSESINATLTENLFGLELDARCSQIGAFNLALTAWRMIGHPAALPSLNLACSGLGIHATEKSWLALAGENRNLRFTLVQSYKLFQKAPTLGSLIDPTRDRRAFIEFDQVWPFLEVALAAEQQNDESRELAIAAKGVLAAARMLAKQFTLVATNVPYLGRGKQSSDLAKYCEEFHAHAKADLATCFVDRCLRFCIDGGSVALVTPQNWLFLSTYGKLRERLLATVTWNVVAKLGFNAFQIMNWWASNTSLLVLSKAHAAVDHRLVGIDVSEQHEPEHKAAQLCQARFDLPMQGHQLENPEARIVTSETSEGGASLSDYGYASQGISPGDTARFTRSFWENERFASPWVPLQSSAETTNLFTGLSYAVIEHRHPALSEVPGFRLCGEKAWGKAGVAIAKMSSLPASIYMKVVFDANTPVVTVRDLEHLPAIWCYVSSPLFAAEVRRLDQKLDAAVSVFDKVPFDLSKWTAMARTKFPAGIPNPA